LFVANYGVDMAVGMLGGWDSPKPDCHRILVHFEIEKITNVKVGLYVQTI